eukprot:3932228-Rhodomonas_salina.1
MARGRARRAKHTAQNIELEFENKSNVNVNQSPPATQSTRGCALHCARSFMSRQNACACSHAARSFTWQKFTENSEEPQHAHWNSAMSVRHGCAALPLEESGGALEEGMREVGADGAD